MSVQKVFVLETLLQLDPTAGVQPFQPHVGQLAQPKRPIPLWLFHRPLSVLDPLFEGSDALL